MTQSIHAFLILTMTALLQGGIAPPPPPPGATSTAPVIKPAVIPAPPVHTGGDQAGNPVAGPIVNRPFPVPGPNLPPTFNPVKTPMPLAPITASRPAAGMEPKFVVDKTDVDFGDVDEGKHVESIFKFNNIGKGPLVITEVKPGCACTVTQIEVNGRPYVNGDPILPDSSGVIRARINTEGFGGQDKHTGFKLFTNDVNYPEREGTPFGLVDFKIRLNILRRFQCEPPDNLIDFGGIDNLEPHEKSVIFKSTKGEAFQITGFSPLDTMVDVRAEAIDDSASRWRITATLQAGAPFGMFIKMLTVHTKPEAPAFNISVQGNVHGPVAFDPLAIAFLVIPKGRPAVKILTVRNADKLHDMKLENIHFVDPTDNRSLTGAPAREHDSEEKKHLIVRPKETEKGSFQIEVVVDENMPVGRFYTILSIKTNVPGASQSGSDELRIPISGIVK
ncbi:MAG: DUF1573 domain-containing protein [Planctomycetes bacterium]|nr:DUF1573 domain-containing protein [Planctomycetota bacterium]